MSLRTRLLPLFLVALLGCLVVLPAQVEAGDPEPGQKPGQERGESRDWVAELTDAEKAELTRRGIDLAKLPEGRRQRLAQTLVKLREKLRDPEAAEKIKARLQMLASQGRDGKQRLRGWDRHLRVARSAAHLLQAEHLDAADRTRFAAMSKERQMAAHWALHRLIRSAMGQVETQRVLSALESEQGLDLSVLRGHEQKRAQKWLDQLKDKDLAEKQRQRIHRGLAYSFMGHRMHELMREHGRQRDADASPVEQARQLVAAIERVWPGAITSAMKNFQKRFAKPESFERWIEKSGRPPFHGRNPEGLRRFTVRDTCFKMLYAASALADVRDAESAALAKRLVTLARDLLEKRGGSIEPAFFAAFDQVTWSDRGAVRSFLETWIPKLAPWQQRRIGSRGMAGPGRPGGRGFVGPRRGGRRGPGKRDDGNR